MTTFGGINTPALGNINEDRVIEVVIASKDGSVYVLEGIKGRLVWKFNTEGPIHSAPCLADLDGDGFLDVVVASTNGLLYAIKGKSGRLLWKKKIGAGLKSSPAMKDINYLGTIEVILGAPNGFVFSLEGKTGKQLWKFKTKGAINSPPLLIDVNRDKVLDIIVGSEDNFLYAISGKNGQSLWRFNCGDKITFPPAAGDLNKDNWVEITVCSHNQNIFALNGANGTKRWIYQKRKTIVSSPLLGNFVGDKKLEIAFCCQPGNVVLLNSKGKKIWEKRVKGQISATPSLADFNQDGKLDLIIPTQEGIIYILRGEDGDKIWTAEISEPISSTLCLGDINQDGLLEVVVGGGKRTIFCLATSQKLPPATLLWPTVQGEAAHLANWELVQEEIFFDQLYLKSIRAVHQEDWIKALKNFQRIVKLKPYHKIAKEWLLLVEKQIELLGLQDLLLTKREVKELFEKGVMEYEAGNWKAAYHIFNRVLKADPNYDEAKRLLRRTEQKIKNLAELKRRQKQEEIKRKRIYALYKKGFHLYKNNRFKNAEKIFRKILALDASHTLAREKLKEIKKKLRQAEFEAKEVREYFSAGVEKFNQNQWLEAMIFFKRVLKIAPEHEDALRMLNEVRNSLRKTKTKIELVSFFYDAGLKKIELKQWELAIEDFKEVLLLDPNHNFAQEKIELARSFLHQKKVEKYYQEGLKYLKEEKWNQAIEQFEKVLSLNPDNKEAKEKHLLALRSLEITKGKVKLEDIIKQLIVQGNTSLEEGRLEEAALSFNKILEIDKTRREAREGLVKAHYLLGVKLAKAGEYKLAREKLSSLLTTKQSLPWKVKLWYYWVSFLYYLITRMFFVGIIVILFIFSALYVFLKTTPKGGEE
jgi:outer membrane protein assembly factor BamB/tetratricopeptide (TPR) repeat protein